MIVYHAPGNDIKDRSQLTHRAAYWAFLTLLIVVVIAITVGCACVLRPVEGAGVIGLERGIVKWFKAALREYPKKGLVKF